MGADTPHQPLGDDATEGVGDEIGLDTDVHKAGDGGHGIVGMQGRQHEMAGFCRGDCRRDCLKVAHFTDQNDVRIFTQSSAQATGKATGIGPDFALVDHTVAMAVQVFDRFFKGDDVAVAGGVNVVDHRRECRRFTAAGRSGDED